MFELPDLNAVQRFAQALAPLIQPGDVIELKGTIGVGKTTFARALIRTLGGKEEVLSPTFTLVQTYHLDRLTVWHFDLFRLKHPIDIYELGIEEAMSDGLSLIEWPEKMAPYASRHRVEITFSFYIGEIRKASLKAHGHWRARLSKLSWPSDG
ncbi:MAG TPA: tRNA (adenosine(37)-N6)-threonylcarbamoyltransferase complex ATPase subunit type 1 TsaE [Alphaproteobacteria bacterium]|nr:tRNA (adenosine(37)-N6)-threonylcarbamoyltransferase complex ATPase subunit type 1 TsaE [Alphaproteobacteria bacterium]